MKPYASPILYNRQWINNNDIRSVVSVLKSDFITQGPIVRRFERDLADYCKAKYAVAVSSGTAALHLSMLALDIAKGDRIITSPVTFSASANCALYTGARPLFVDIDDRTYHLDIGKLKDFLKIPSMRKRIKAVIAVYFMGTVIDIVEIKRICERYGIKVVEDATHALGAKYKTGNEHQWTKVGSCKHSDISIFSFHPIKHITTGEGGALLTNNKRIYKTALKLRHHGIIKRRRNFWSYDIPRIGFNYRITDFQCALGISQLNKLEKIVKARRRLVGIYNDYLSKLEEIRLPYERESTYASHHLYVIRVAQNRRNRLYSYLNKNKIYTQINYIPIHLFSYYRQRFGHKWGDFPVSEKYFKECLSLPLYVGLSRLDQLRVINKIKRYLGYE